MQPTRFPSQNISAANDHGRSGGFTIIELIITSALLMLILGVIFGSLEEVVKAEAYTSDRTASIDSMRVMLNRMTREVRQATSLDEATSTATRIEFDTYGNGVARHVVYVATGTTLTRQIDDGTAVPVLTGLATTTMFTYVSAPPVPGAQWVQINVQVRPKRSPDTILILDSEVNLRNRTRVQA